MSFAQSRQAGPVGLKSNQLKQGSDIYIQEARMLKAVEVR